jgi:hypothetical protein
VDINSWSLAEDEVENKHFTRKNDCEGANRINPMELTIKDASKGSKIPLFRAEIKESHISC